MNLQLWKFALDYIFHYIYKTPKVPFESLTNEQIKQIQMWQPRTPAEHFPEDYPDEEGYEGDYWDLYRGIFCKTEKEYKQLIEEVKNGTITYHTITSWSHLPSIAEQFAKGAGYYSYTHEPSVKGFKGVVLKAEPIYKESTFFFSMEVGEELEEEYEEFFKNREPERIFHHNEEEIVLLPGTYPVTIYQIFDLDKE